MGDHGIMALGIWVYAFGFRVYRFRDESFEDFWIFVGLGLWVLGFRVLGAVESVRIQGLGCRALGSRALRPTLRPFWWQVFRFQEWGPRVRLGSRGRRRPTGRRTHTSQKPLQAPLRGFRAIGPFIGLGFRVYRL